MRRLTIALLLLAGCGESAPPPAPVPAAPAAFDLAALDATNLLYGGDIEERDEAGREIRRLHRKIVDALEGTFTALDAAYDGLRSASDRLAAAATVVQVRLREAGADPSRDEGMLSYLYALAVGDQGFDAAVAETRAERDAVPGPTSESVLKSTLQTSLLRHYADARVLNLTRLGSVCAYLAAAHHASSAWVPAEVRAKAAAALREEEDAIVGLIAADEALGLKQGAATFGLTGLYELFRGATKLRLEQLDAILVECRVAGEGDEADLARSTVHGLRVLAQGLHNAEAAMDAASPSLLGRDAILARGPTPASPKWLYGAPVAGPFDLLRKVADGTVAAVSAAGSAVASGGRAVYGGAVQLVRTTAVGYDVGTQIIANELVAYVDNLSPEQKAGLYQDMNARFRDEIKSGRAGASALSRMTGFFAGVEQSAEGGVEGVVGSIVGHGMISAAAGKLGNAVTGLATGLPKAIAQLSNPDATPGDRFEGVFTLVTAALPLGKLAAKAGGSVAGRLARSGTIKGLTWADDIAKALGRVVEKSPALRAMVSAISSRAASTLTKVHEAVDRIAARVIGRAAQAGERMTEAVLKRMPKEAAEAGEAYLREFLRNLGLGEGVEKMVGKFKEATATAVGMVLENIASNSVKEVLDKTVPGVKRAEPPLQPAAPARTIEAPVVEAPKRELKPKVVNYDDGAGPRWYAYTYYAAPGGGEVKHGEFQEWHRNGTRALTVNYTDGFKDGVERQWDEKGRDSVIWEFKAGQYVPDTHYYWLYDSEGKAIKKKGPT